MSSDPQKQNSFSQLGGIPAGLKYTYHSTMALLTIGCLVLGVYLSQIEYLGFEWFSRSGSMIVILGIWSGLGGIIQERFILGQLAFRYRMSLARAKRKFRLMQAEEDIVLQEIAAMEQQYNESIDLHQNALKLRVGLLEVCLLVLGTFIWGFGDIIMAMGIFTI